MISYNWLKTAWSSCTVLLVFTHFSAWHSEHLPDITGKVSQVTLHGCYLMNADSVMFYIFCSVWVNQTTSYASSKLDEIERWKLASWTLWALAKTHKRLLSQKVQVLTWASNKAHTQKCCFVYYRETVASIVCSVYLVAKCCFVSSHVVRVCLCSKWVIHRRHQETSV